METKVYLSTYRDPGVASPPSSFPPPPTTNTTTAVAAAAAPLLTVTSNSGSSGVGGGGGLMGAMDVVMAALRGQKQAPRACEQGLRLLVLACEGEVPLPYPQSRHDRSDCKWDPTCSTSHRLLVYPHDL